jgi:proteasome assembly chaperone (PAC2) family protein
LITIARERTPEVVYVSNWQVCVEHNVKKLQIKKDDKDNGKTFNTFAKKFIHFVLICEDAGLEWPFEKFYWDHWRLLRCMQGGMCLLEDYLERSKTEQFNWDSVLDAYFDMDKLNTEIERLEEKAKERGDTQGKLKKKIENCEEKIKALEERNERANKEWNIENTIIPPEEKQENEELELCNDMLFVINKIVKKKV